MLEEVKNQAEMKLRINNQGDDGDENGNKDQSKLENGNEA